MSRGSLTITAPAPPGQERAQRFTSSSTAPRDVTETAWTRVGTAVLDPTLEGEPFETVATLTLGAIFVRTAGAGNCDLRLAKLSDGAQVLTVSSSSPSAEWGSSSGSSQESAFAVEARVSPGTTGRLDLWTACRLPPP